MTFELELVSSRPSPKSTLWPRNEVGSLTDSYQTPMSWVEDDELDRVVARCCWPGRVLVHAQDQRDRSRADEVDRPARGTWEQSEALVSAHSVTDVYHACISPPRLSANGVRTKLRGHPPRDLASSPTPRSSLLRSLASCLLRQPLQPSSRSSTLVSHTPTSPKTGFKSVLTDSHPPTDRIDPDRGDLPAEPKLAPIGCPDLVERLLAKGFGEVRIRRKLLGRCRGGGGLEHPEGRDAMRKAERSVTERRGGWKAKGG